MKTKLLCVLFLFGILVQAKGQKKIPDEIKTYNGTLKIWPVLHASMVLSWNGKTIYTDPTGDAGLYKGLSAPDIILITDIHGDHLDLQTLKAVNSSRALIIAPKAVADMLPENLRSKVVILNNNSKTSQLGITITAIPMYNIPETADAPHIKGRGNGYILNMGGKNVYISGDTGDTPEMRGLKNIDIAFVCMNLPYTMDVNQAASAVLAFKPAIVYPFHYRGQNVETFRKLVNDGDPHIEVRLRDWYPAGAGK